MNIIDRESGKLYVEESYGKSCLQFLYSRDSFLSRFLRFWISRPMLFSSLFGFYLRLPFSKGKIVPFIKRFGIKKEEFEKQIEDFSSFDDFFVRRLKKEARPIAAQKNMAIIPADGKALVFAELDKAPGFYVKGKKFSLSALFKDESFAKKYEKGSLCIIRLSPEDYHRFHFLLDCTPEEPRLINGLLFSVNPIALKSNISIFSENKRVSTLLKTDAGDVAMIEVGATGVGSIKELFVPGRRYSKGDEKGYFELGGSTIMLFFEKGKMEFEKDLLQASAQGMEMKVKMGQPLGKVC